MENQDVFSVSLDAGAIIVEFNETASIISGYRRDEVIGKNWFELFIPESDTVEVLDVFTDLFHGENSHWEYTNDITCKDGSLKKIRWINNIIRDEDLNPKLIYSLGVEVTN
ncbi:MAG: PAS domain S-box protein [Campylobacterota bacterium]|nr:PAS domain S-box protein [Campylobacterota bacterium]